MGLFRTAADFRREASTSFHTPGRPRPAFAEYCDQAEAEYHALTPRIEAARQKLAEARAIQLSREETKRCIRESAFERIREAYLPVLDARLSAPDSETFDPGVGMTLDPSFPGRGVGDAYYGFGPLEAVIALIPDLIWPTVEQRIDQLVPKSAKGTLASRRRAIADAEAEVSRLENEQASVLGKYRLLLDNRAAEIGDHHRIFEAEMQERAPE